MTSTSIRITLSALFALSLVAGIAAAAPAARAETPPNIRCAVAKRSATIRRLRAIDACSSKPPKMNTPPPDPACLASAERQFQKEFQHIEARGGCLPATGDAPAAARVGDQCESLLLRTLPGTCQAAGEACGGSNAPCCDGLVCHAILGQPATCG